MGGTKLPFDVDPDLEKEVLEYDANGANAEEKDAKSAFVWPVSSTSYARPTYKKDDVPIIDIRY